MILDKDQKFLDHRKLNYLSKGSNFCLKATLTTLKYIKFLLPDVEFFVNVLRRLLLKKSFDTKYSLLLDKLCL